MARAKNKALMKLPQETTDLANYEFHDRATEVYNHWMSGFTEDEIASFHNLKPDEVKKDLMYVQTRLPVRSIISHHNDRNRILVQREKSQDFRKLLGDTLKMGAEAILAAGVSPAGILKEFREATGMVQRAEPLIQVNTQQNFGSASPTNGRGINSTEDVIRKVLDRINHNALASNAPVQEAEIVSDAEPQEGDQEDQVPDED